MDVPERLRLRSRRLQFTVRTLLISSLVAALLVQFGPSAFRRVFPRQPELPAPWIRVNDDVQYFPAGPEFKLSKEAAALKGARRSERNAR